MSVLTTDKPRLLDLFCKAGGCTRGYQLAGFYVVGVDIEPQANYVGDEFIQTDAVAFLQSQGYEFFDAIHASPPCQAHSILQKQNKREYPDLVAPVRELLKKSKLPYVIENVEGAPLEDPLRLCGSAFGLGVRRHRLFETNFPIMAPGCSHGSQPLPIDVTGTGGPGGRSRKPRSVAQAREAMGIEWMDRQELNQAIPPAYCEHIGGYLLQAVEMHRESRNPVRF